MVRSHGDEGWEGKYRKDKGHDLQYHDQTDLHYQTEDVATVISRGLLANLELENLDLILRERGLLWFVHVERSSGVFTTACDKQVEGRQWPGRPKMMKE